MKNKPQTWVASCQKKKHTVRKIITRNHTTKVFCPICNYKYEINWVEGK